MFTVNIPDLMQMIKHVAVEQREPLMIWGPPGVGKSEAMRQTCSEDGGLLIDIRLSQYDSVDLRGIPSVDAGTTVWNVPSTLPFKSNPAFDHVPDSQWIYLFLDEINSASNAVAAVAYLLINDRAVGEHELHDNVVIVAAGNREGDKGVTNKMPLPLANRFTHVEVGVDANAWCDHAISRGVHALGVAFIRFRKPLLSTFDPTKPQKAFATPRTWMKAFKYFASDMPDHIKQASMAGAVGEGNAAEFSGFVKTYESVKSLLPSIMRDPTGVDVPTDLSTKYAVCVALSGELDTKNADTIHLFLERVEPDIMIMTWQLALKRDADLYTTDAFLALATTYRDVFRGA